MNERETTVGTDDGQMTTFVCHPDEEGPFPVAVLYMDGVGYRDQIKENARRFAADGYYCIAPDLFYRSGEKLSFDFTRMGETDSRERLMRHRRERYGRPRDGGHWSAPRAGHGRPGRGGRT